MSVPPFSISSGLGHALMLALDSEGNLYVANNGAASDLTPSILVYEPPFSTTSTPSLTLALPSGAGVASGVAIGL